MTKQWVVYLSGEIHSDWRERIQTGAQVADLNVEFVAPITDHAKSDDCGASILGAEDNSFWHDKKASGINAIRTRTAIERADIVVVRFGDQYRQWNAAFDAGYAVAKGKSIITLHEPELNHALKEIDGAANAACQTPEQVVAILGYVMGGG